MTVFAIYSENTCTITSSYSDASDKLSENENLQAIAFCSFEEAYCFVQQNKISTCTNDDNIIDAFTIYIETRKHENSYQWSVKIENSLEQYDYICNDIHYESESQAIISAIQHVIDEHSGKKLRFKTSNSDIVKLFKYFRQNKNISTPHYVSALFRKLIDSNAYLVMR